MKVIGITGQKGGCGKTTISINLAAFYANAGLKISIVDRDPQNAIRTWAKQRESELPFDIHDEIGAKLGVVVNAKKQAGFDLVIVDTAPTIGGAFLEIPNYADLILLPCRPSLLDIQSLVDSIYALNKKFPDFLCRSVLTQVTNRFQITKKSIETLNEVKAPILSTIVSNRTVFQNTFSEGKTVFDIYHNEGGREITALAREINEFIDLL